MHVGLPDGQMGNSEVGHLNIGAGRVVYQDLTRIDHAIATGEFADNPVLLRRARSARASRRARSTCSASCRRAACTATRSTSRACSIWPRPRRRRRRRSCTRSSTAATRRRRAPRRRSQLIEGRLRHRQRRPHRVDRRPLLRDGPRPALGARAARLRRAGRTATRRFTAPIALDGARTPRTRAARPTSSCSRRVVLDRPSRRRDATTATRRLLELPRRPRARAHARVRRRRVRRLSRARPRPEARDFVMLTRYGDDFARVPVAFARRPLDNVRRVARAARADAAAHRRDREVRARDVFLQRRPRGSPSRARTASGAVAEGRDLRPAAGDERARGDRQARRRRSASGQYDAIVCNYANGDMVGHTGIFDAAVQAVETLDACSARIVDARWQARAAKCLITADHGNVEQMHDPTTGQPHTAHTLRPGAARLRRAAATARAPAARWGRRADAARADAAAEPSGDDRAPRHAA